MSDTRNLHRFIDAQESDYRSALAEITAGRKRSHRMWYIFPQYDGLGFSSTSKHYAIKSPAEAVESRHAWTIIDGNRIAEASTNFRPQLELEFAIDNYVQTAAAWHQSQQTPSRILFTDFVTEWQATQGTSPN